MIDAAHQIVVKEKMTGLYRGLLPTLIQIAPQTGFQFAFYSFFASVWRLVVHDNVVQREGLGLLLDVYFPFPLFVTTNSWKIAVNQNSPHGEI